MSSLSKYSKMDKEDPDERSHRYAQFRIYKVMEKADSRRRQSPLKVRLCRLKINTGKRCKKLKKNLLSGVKVARVGVYKQMMRLLIKLKCLLCSKDAKASLRPMFK